LKTWKSHLNLLLVIHDDVQEWCYSTSSYSLHNKRTTT
jgi:hypothetical protein